MHKLRPLKPKILWGRTPRPPYKKRYRLGVILQTSMHPGDVHVTRISRRNPFWSPNIYIMSITTWAESKFIKIVDFTPHNEVPKSHLFPPEWPKYTKNDLKLGENDLKYYDQKWDFPLGGLTIALSWEWNPQESQMKFQSVLCLL